MVVLQIKPNTNWTRANYCIVSCVGYTVAFCFCLRCWKLACCHDGSFGGSQHNEVQNNNIEQQKHFVRNSFCHNYCSKCFWYRYHHHAFLMQLLFARCTGPISQPVSLLPHALKTSPMQTANWLTFTCRFLVTNMKQILSHHKHPPSVLLARGW